MNTRLVANRNNPTHPSIMPVQTGLLQRQCACGQHSGNGGKCESCRKKRDGLLQRAAVHPSALSPQPAGLPPIVHNVLHSAGRALEPETRAMMELHFGRDFSHVRVHTDGRAAESARAVNALAYTVGRDMVFAEGRYQPRTREGRGLLAHELTHVAQQNSASIPENLTLGQSESVEEQEAERMSASAAERQVSEQLAAEPIKPAGDQATNPELALLAGGLRLATAGHNHSAIDLLQLSARRVTDQPGLSQQRSAATTRSTADTECPTCVAHQPQHHTVSTPTVHNAGRGPATLARQAGGRQRSVLQCINANLANAGIPWAIITILGGICGILGAVAGLATGPAAPAASPSGAAVAAALCIAGVTGLAVGTVLGVITRCAQDPSVEWVFAQAETGGAGSPAEGATGAGAETATA